MNTAVIKVFPFPGQQIEQRTEPADLTGVRFVAVPGDFPESALTAVVIGRHESYATDSAGHRYAMLGMGITAGEAMNDAFDITNNPIIVTRHTGLVEWLRQRGIVGEVIAHATPENVTGRDVIGALPMHLAALADSVTVVDLPNLRPDQRGQDLTPEEMDAAGASLARYTVRRVA